MTFSKTIKVNFIMVCNPDVPTYTYKDVNIDTTDTGFVMDISFYTKHGNHADAKSRLPPPLQDQL